MHSADMSDYCVAGVWFLAASVFCLIACFLLSPQAKRRIGIWLIAKADSEDAAKEHFKARKAQLALELCCLQPQASPPERGCQTIR